ncbi:hypothetical protein ABTE40_20785, partial [Acinetobacter baumannii]
QERGLHREYPEQFVRRGRRQHRADGKGARREAAHRQVGFPALRLLGKVVRKEPAHAGPPHVVHWRYVREPVRLFTQDQGGSGEPADA